MDNCRCITSVWKVTVSEAEVFNRFIDENIQESQRRAAGNAPSLTASDNDKAIMHRYYCACLAELSAMLAKRTRKYGGNITNTVDETTKMITTVYDLAMTCNHEPELVEALGAHCLEFLIARLMEKWYGHGSDFGSENEKGEIKHIINYRRRPVELTLRTL